VTDDRTVRPAASVTASAADLMPSAPVADVS